MKSTATAASRSRPARLLIALACAAAAAPATAQCQVAKFGIAQAQKNDFFGSGAAISGDWAVVGAAAEEASPFRSGAATFVHRVGDSWTPGPRVTPADGNPFDLFGRAVDIDGDWAVIAAPLNIVNGISDAGAVYVYHLQGNAFVFHEKLTAPNPVQLDQFGIGVALHGDRIVVGAPFAGPNDRGQAYVFRLDGQDWVFEKELGAPNGQQFDVFGQSVEVDSSRIIVGAMRLANSPGSAFVFRKEGDTDWVFEAELKPSDGKVGDQIGISVQIVDDTAVVGGPTADFGAQNAGAAWVFRRSGESWTEEAKLLPQDPTGSGNFGRAIGLSQDTVVVGCILAPGEPGQPTKPGAVYFYAFDGAQWSPPIKLPPTDAVDFMTFGWSVATDGASIIAGAVQDTFGGPDKFGSAYILSVVGGEQAIYDVLPSLLEWTAHLPGLGDAHAQSTVVGTLGVTLTIDCAGIPRAHITNIDLETLEGLIDLEGFGYSALIHDPQIKLGGGFGDPGPAAQILNDCCFNQKDNGEVLLGIIDYDVLGFEGQFDLASLPPRPQDIPGFFTPAPGGLTLPVNASGVIDFGLGDDNPTLTLTGTLASLLADCYADFTGDGTLDLFDFLGYVNAFNTSDPKADCDSSGSLDLFDFLCFANAFNAGC